MGASSPTSPEDRGCCGRQTSQRALLRALIQTSKSRIWSFQDSSSRSALLGEKSGMELHCSRWRGGALHKGQLPPNIPMHTFAAAVHLRDLHVTFRELLLYGCSGPPALAMPFGFFRITGLTYRNFCGGK